MASDTINQDLHQAFVKMLRKAHSIILDAVNPSIPKREVYKIITLPDRTLRYELMPIPDSIQFARTQENKITNTSEFINFVSSINKDRNIAEHFSRHVNIGFFSRNMSPLDLIIFTLAKMIDRYDEKAEDYGIYYDNEIVKKTYKDLEGFLYTETIPIIDIVPLDNFNSDVESAEIQDFILRKIRQDEKELYLTLSNKGPMRVMSWKHVFEFKYDLKKTIYGGRDLSDKIQDSKMPKLIQELRLFKKGSVGYSFLIAKVDLFLPLGTWYSTRNHRELVRAVLPDARPDSPVEDFGNIFILYENEITNFKTFSTLLNNVVEAEDRFNLAVRRFNYSYGREKVEDKIIDFAISLESLFSKKNDGFDSITYKLAMRTSRLWKISGMDHTKIFKDVKTFYDARSKIVHGDSDEKRKYLNKIDVDNIENIIRESLGMYVRKVNYPKVSHDEFIESLDFA